MEIKCNLNPYYIGNYYNSRVSKVPEDVAFNGCVAQKAKSVGLCADKFVKRPVAEKNANGLFGLIKSFNNYRKNYVKNIQHTYEHKVVFALVEKELFGNNSIDSVTHDLDKLVLYTLGFPKSFVSEFHRKHSVHHTESGKNINLRSMLCDNIASSPEFKPEKKHSLREHFKHSKELQKVKGFKKLLQQFNYGENLDFGKIKEEMQLKTSGLSGVLLSIVKAFLILV